MPLKHVHILSRTGQEEMKYDMYIAASQRVEMSDGSLSGTGLFVLSTLWAWKDRLGLP